MVTNILRFLYQNNAKQCHSVIAFHQIKYLEALQHFTGS